MFRRHWEFRDGAGRIIDALSVRSFANNPIIALAGVASRTAAAAAAGTAPAIVGRPLSYAACFCKSVHAAGRRARDATAARRLISSIYYISAERRARPRQTSPPTPQNPTSHLGGAGVVGGLGTALKCCEHPRSRRRRRRRPHGP